ncbi:MAG: aminotransferase class I/II-fold pyridoxal phosphate-dependent enzyme [Rhodopirellula sp. JB044]|uniref:aminotransferase class I/II-fold pyridoxal phosphate-dependent enzyme n=1 Tax=Rhodopirellula sp. JB044 TaxID=3342844 RepID=UPI00370B3EE9
MPDRNPFDDFARSLDEMKGLGRARRLVVQYVDGVSLMTDQSERLLNFGGNDYLGIVADGIGHDEPGGDGNAAKQITLGKEPSGATASPLVCGWTPAHDRLAQSIARLERTESAVVFPSGYAACCGAVATLCRDGDLILSDELNHASLIDGCRASKADRVVYPHRDVRHVERVLQESRSRYRRVWIVTDGVFSMDGDAAPLRELVHLAERYDAQILVDEAHGTGVLGQNGGGLCEALGVRDHVAVRIGTLSKAIGHQGGFVAGPRVVTDYLVQFCRTLIFSTALSPRTAAGADRVIASMEGLRSRRERVTRLAAYLREQFANRLPDRMLVPCGGNDATAERDIFAGIPIVPVIIGRDEATVAISERLRERGFYVPAIRPPTVPEGTARLRISLSAAHQRERIDGLVDAIVSLV